MPPINPKFLDAINTAKIIQLFLQWRQFLWFTVSSGLVIIFLWKTILDLGKKNKHKCVWWSWNNILKPLAIQCWEGFTQTTRFILFPGRTQKIVVNTDKMTEYFTVSVLTKQAGCLNIAPMRKSFYALSVKTRSGIYWRIEMCHDWEEVKSLKIQP